jgi:Flp pilus assembly protein TadG
MYFEPKVKLGRRFARGRTKGQRGQALVEFVIAFPLLVILFLFLAVQTWFWWNLVIPVSFFSNLPAFP